MFFVILFCPHGGVEQMVDIAKDFRQWKAGDWQQTPNRPRNTWQLQTEEGYYVALEWTIE